MCRHFRRLQGVENESLSHMTKSEVPLAAYVFSLAASNGCVPRYVPLCEVFFPAAAARISERRRTKTILFMHASMKLNAMNQPGPSDSGNATKDFV